MVSIPTEESHSALSPQLSTVATVKVKSMKTVKVMTGIIKYVLHNASCKGLDRKRFKKKRREQSFNVKPESNLNAACTQIYAPKSKGKAGAREDSEGLWDGGVGQHCKDGSSTLV